MPDRSRFQFALEFQPCIGDKGSSRKGMKEEIFLIVKIVDAEVERNIFRRVIMDACIDDEEAVERAVDVGNDVGVI